MGCEGVNSLLAGTVLVVAANAETNAFIARALRDSYRVLRARDTREALTLAAADKPDLVITDAMMTVDAIPIVVLTSNADEGFRLRLRKAGAQDYLAQPIVVEELRARVATLIAAAKSREMERASRAKDEFLSVISHELRTPLNVVQGWLWQLKRSGDNVAVRERAIEVIERNVAVQTRLVEDLLDTSRAVMGKLHLRKRLVDLTALCRTTVDATQRHAQEKHLTLAFSEPAEPIFIWGDADRLQQTVSNVLSNALKFTPSGGAVRVTARRTGLRTRIEVTDTGIGIPEDFLESIFEPFSQADRTETRRYGGLGLGLAIVRQIVTLHGGSVAASSAGENQGATIVLDFPVPAVLDDPERHNAHPETEPLRRELAGVKVLVVDDEPDACEIVKRILEHHGAMVRTAESASEALHQLTDLQPDVLVADVAIPGADGYELVRQLRALPEWRDLPALALTAYVDRAGEEALGAGFQQYRAKPIPPADLVAVVATLAGPVEH
jgi:signal transduction histidine kinase